MRMECIETTTAGFKFMSGFKLKNKEHHSTRQYREISDPNISKELIEETYNFTKTFTKTFPQNFQYIQLLKFQTT